jgi:hypothetical protein
MKTLACFLATWVTATALLLWLATRHDTNIDFVGAHITLSEHHGLGKEFWHSLWVAAVYSLLNTFIVRFWQMQWELRTRSSNG